MRKAWLFILFVLFAASAVASVQVKTIQGFPASVCVPSDSNPNCGGASSGVNWPDIGGLQSDINVGGFTNDVGYLTTESDTLSTVTSRGATTSTASVFSTSISTPSLISTGSIGITPASGSNLNITLSTTGDFAVNSNQLYVDTSAARVGVGDSAPSNRFSVGNSSASLSNIATLASSLTSSNASIDSFAYCKDGSTSTRCAYSSTESTWSLGYVFSTSKTVSKIRWWNFATSERNKHFKIEYSLDGSTSWTKISITGWADLSSQSLTDEADAANSDGWNTVTFSPVTAKGFRVTVTSFWSVGDANAGINEIEMYAAITNFLEVTSTGRVGIGTPSPLTTLHVVGTGKFEDAVTITGDTSATSFTIGANSLTTSEWAYLDGQDQAVKKTSSPTFSGGTTISKDVTTDFTIQNTTNTGRSAIYLKQAAGNRAGFYFYDTAYATSNLQNDLRIYLDSSGDILLDHVGNMGFTLEPAEKFTLGASHKIGWEASTGVVDTYLYRSAAGTLKTDGHFSVEGVTSTGATGTGKIVFDASPTITGTPSLPGGSSGKATCWKTSTAIGYCSSAVASDGACTCN